MTDILLVYDDNNIFHRFLLTGSPSGCSNGWWSYRSLYIEEDDWMVDGGLIGDRFDAPKICFTGDVGHRTNLLFCLFIF